MARTQDGGYICDLCGQVWDVHPFSLAPCSVCGAKRGQRCSRPSGHKGPMVEYHVEREQLALDLGLLDKCPAGSSASASAQLKFDI